MSDPITLTSYIVLVLAPTVHDGQIGRNITLSILAAHNCTIQRGEEPHCPLDTAAELWVDGKMIGSIPLDALTPPEVERLKETVERLR